MCVSVSVCPRLMFILTSAAAEPKRSELKTNRFSDFPISRYVPDTLFTLEMAADLSLGLYLPGPGAACSIYLLFYAYYPFTYSTLFHPSTRPFVRRLTVRLAHYQNLRMLMNFDFFFALSCFVSYTI